MAVVRVRCVEVVHEPDALALVELQTEGGRAAIIEESGVGASQWFKLTMHAFTDLELMSSLSHLCKRITDDAVPAFSLDLGRGEEDYAPGKDPGSLREALYAGCASSATRCCARMRRN